MNAFTVRVEGGKYDLQRCVICSMLKLFCSSHCLNTCECSVLSMTYPALKSD